MLRAGQTLQSVLLPVLPPTQNFKKGLNPPDIGARWTSGVRAADDSEMSTVASHLLTVHNNGLLASSG